MKKIVLLTFVFLLLSTAVVVGFVGPAVAEGPIYIRADGSVEGTDKIQRDGNVYTFTDDIGIDEWSYGIIIERDNIVVDGAGHVLKGHIVDIIEHFSQSKPLTTGINLDGRNNITIKNLQIMEFNTGLRGNCTNIKILGNNITNNVEGIWFSWSSLNTFSGNNITGNINSGILLESCSNCTFSENNIADNRYGMKIQYFSNNNVVSGNKVTKNSATGIQIEFSSNYNVVSGNCITDNYHGIGIDGSFNNIVSGNNITNNIKYGIWLGGQASNNTFSGNNITNNDAGIYNIREASANKFYHNNFINNAKQVYDLGIDFPDVVSPSVNIWDDGYPSGGNYWSDYTGEDANGDGIGDTPYVICEKNQDNYPLMRARLINPVVIPEFPDEENPTPTTEPFPITWIVAAIAIIAIGVVAILVYFKRSRKQPGKPKNNNRVSSMNINVTNEDYPSARVRK